MTCDCVDKYVTVDLVQVLSSKLLEQETFHRQLSQEQLDNFTLDMNTAYARLKGMEEAIDSEWINLNISHRLI